MRRFLLVLLALALAPLACADAPQSPVSFDAFATVDTRPREGGWSLELARAKVGFGPAYFCASAAGSSTLCASAVAELRGQTMLDALAPGPHALGRASGFSGTVRSASFDLGIDWFDTMAAPAASAAAPDGASFVAEGTARKAGRPEVPFVVRVEVVPQYQGQLAVPTSAADAVVGRGTTRLDVSFAVGAWLSAIDFDAAADAGISPLVVLPGTTDHDRVLLAIRNLLPPTFTFR